MPADTSLNEPIANSEKSDDLIHEPNALKLSLLSKSDKKMLGQLLDVHTQEASVDEVGMTIETTLDYDSIDIGNFLEKALEALKDKKQKPSIEISLIILQICINTIYSRMKKLETQHSQLDNLLTSYVRFYGNEINRLAREMTKYLSEPNSSAKPNLIALDEIAIFGSQFLRTFMGTLSEKNIGLSRNRPESYAKLYAVTLIATVNIYNKINPRAKNDNLQDTTTTNATEANRETPPNKSSSATNATTNNCGKMILNRFMVFFKPENSSPSSSAKDRSCGSMPCTIL